MQTTTSSRYTSAQFIAHHISESIKSQEQIAQEAGFSSGNALAMIVAESIKMPLGQVAQLAKALDADPAHLLRLVLQEGASDAYRVIETVLGGPVLTSNERELIRLMRILTHGFDPSWLVMPGDILKGIIPTRPSADLWFEMHLAGSHDERAEPMYAVAGGC